MNVPAKITNLKLMETSSTWAERLARTLLVRALPRRWAHVQGVAARARSLAPTVGADADLLEAAAWLHDIGYLPELAISGLHGLDGARYLRDVQHADPMPCHLVAHHSCAVIEAEERRPGRRPAPRVRPAAGPLADASRPSARPPSRRRRAGARDPPPSRDPQPYGSGHLVSRSIRRATPLILQAVDHVHATKLYHSQQTKREDNERERT